MNDDTRIEIGSGNVFKDLGFPNPEEELLKARLGYEIYRILKQRKFSKEQAAEWLGIEISQAAALMKTEFDMEVGDLFNLLNRLNVSVDIYLKPTSEGGAYQQLHAAD